MSVKRRSLAVGISALLGIALVGCIDAGSFFDPNFISALGLGTRVSDLPDDAPGVRVTVANQTTEWTRIAVSYRDENSNVRSFTTTLAPGDETSQMLVCPVEEITLGDVTNLTTSGAVVYLVDRNVTITAETLQTAPFVEVEAFGVLLRDTINYSCGDEVEFSVLPADTNSGYRTFAFIKPSESNQ